MKVNMWYVCLILAFLAICVAIVLCFIRYRRSRSRKKYGKNENKGRSLPVVTWWIIAIFAASFFLLLPMGWESVSGSGTSWAVLDVVPATFREALQVFSLDGEYIDDLYEAIDAAKLQPFIYECCRFFGSLLYVAAPILLVGIIISVFRDLFARTRLHFTRKDKIYLFSELNSESLALAKSILADEREKEKQSQIVFTDVYNKNDEESTDLQTQAKNLGAICTETDILYLGTDFSKKKWKTKGNMSAGERPVNFFILGSNQTENIEHASRLIDRYRECDNISLYILADSEEEQTLISAAIKGGTDDSDTENNRIQLRFINPAQSLVYNYLYAVKENQLFTHTTTLENGEEALSIVLVGLGNYGLEFLRAFLWYTQVRGVHLQVHVYEKDPLAEQKFASLCPEVMQLNHQPIEGEVSYDIWFETAGEGKGMDADTADFDQSVKELPFISAAYVTLGDDDADIHTAIKLRRLMLKKDTDEKVPMFITVVNDEIKYNLAKNTEYDITFIGNLQDAWSKQKIISPELEIAARKNHVNWANTESDPKKEAAAEKKFYQDNYSYKSSTAKTVRKEVQINNPKITETYLDSEEAWRLENNGWNAYMRSEGFRQTENKNIPLKQHNKIKPYDKLSDEDKKKNSYG